MSSFQIWCLLQVSNSWDGACVPWKRSGHWGYEFLEFWCWNLVPFLPDNVFQLLKRSCSSMMRQMFFMSERSGLQAGQFMTQTLVLWSNAVVIATVCGFALSCWNTQCLPWNRCHLEGSICCSKTFIYLSALIVPSKTCKHLCTPIPSEILAFELNADNTQEGLVRRTWRPWFPTRMSNLDSSDHRTLWNNPF